MTTMRDLVHDSWTAQCWPSGMDSRTVSGDVVVRRSDFPCDLADTRRPFVSSAGTGGVPGAVAGRAVGATSVGSLGATGRYKCQGPLRVLFPGASIVLGVVEPSSTVIVGSRCAHVPFESNRHSTLR